MPNCEKTWPVFLILFWQSEIARLLLRMVAELTLFVLRSELFLLNYLLLCFFFLYLIIVYSSTNRAQYKRSSLSWFQLLEWLFKLVGLACLTKKTKKNYAAGTITDGMHTCTKPTVYSKKFITHTYIYVCKWVAAIKILRNRLQQDM